MKSIFLFSALFVSSSAFASTPLVSTSLANYSGDYTATNCAGLVSAVVQADAAAQTFTLQLTDSKGAVATSIIDLNARHSVHTQCTGYCTREIRTIVRGAAIIEQYREIGLVFKPLWTDEATLVKFGNKALSLPGYGESCELVQP